MTATARDEECSPVNGTGRAGLHFPASRDRAPGGGQEITRRRLANANPSAVVPRLVSSPLQEPSDLRRMPMMAAGWRWDGASVKRRGDAIQASYAVRL